MRQKPLQKLDEMSTMASGAVEGASSNHHFINRDQFLKELQLREVIRKVIAISESKTLIKEHRLRKIIRNLIVEAEADKTPHASTAINFLEDLLKKILPAIEQDYKSLTTKKEQRDAFRAQLVDAINSMLETAHLNIQASKEQASVGQAPEEFIDIEEEIEINVSDEEKFIDIENETEEDAEIETDEAQANETGSKLAAQAFDAIEKQTLESYNTLSDEEDQETFKDYLITNIKLYFDKWEKELSEVIEPTTDEYEAEKTDADVEEVGDELSGEEEFEL